MRQPPGLSAAGARLWEQMKAALPEGWTYDEREQAILERACRQADDLAELEKAIKRDGVVANGSQGQKVLNGLVSEARQARVVIARLLGEVTLPDETAEKPQTAASRRGQKAANTRWAARDRRRVSVG
jgi:Phage terminase, small subunit